MLGSSGYFPFTAFSYFVNTLVSRLLELECLIFCGGEWEGGAHRPFDLVGVAGSGL